MSDQAEFTIEQIEAAILETLAGREAGVGTTSIVFGVTRRLGGENYGGVVVAGAKMRAILGRLEDRGEVFQGTAPGEVFKRELMWINRELHETREQARRDARLSHERQKELDRELRAKLEEHEIDPCVLGTVQVTLYRCDLEKLLRVIEGGKR